ncbi:MAG: hypothetical protein OXE96_15175 [Gemmatimonadetes bacterium]|nr:hypothetical protein [Gemmatimonadota bacterium]
MGNTLLAARLEKSLSFLSTQLHVPVPNHGRHKKALDVLADPDLVENVAPNRILAAHRLAWETFLIVAAALEDRRNGASPYTQRRLRTFVKGPLEREGRDGSPRNVQFELTVATHFRLASCTVYDGEPDILLLFGQEKVGIAAKRVRSLNPTQLRKRAKEAAEQIDKSKMRGWVALNLDTRVADIAYDGGDGGATTEKLSRAFDEVSETLAALGSPNVLGHMMFGYLASWHPPVGSDPAGLHFGVPFRWMCIPRRDGDEALFSTFSRGWAERFDRRMVAMQRPTFNRL